MKVGHTVKDDCTRAASIMAKLNHQRTQVNFCDCVIRKGQGQVYPVHRCVLAASSPVLASMLHSSGVLVELNEPCLTDTILGLLLDYIYTGTLPHLDNRQHSFLISAAQYLEMDELQKTLRTKDAFAPGHYNSTHSDGENHQKDSHQRYLPLDAASRFLTVNDGVPMKNNTNAAYNASKLTVHNCGMTETTQTSHSISSCSQTQQMSKCQSEEKNLPDGAIKLNILKKSKARETRSYSSDSTKTQEHEQFQDEKTCGFGPQGNVKAQEINHVSDALSHNSSCCSTSVICHSSRVTRIQEENASAKYCHDTEASTGNKSLSEKIYCDFPENMETQNHHSVNQYLEKSVLPVHNYSVPSFNLIQNNYLTNNNYSDEDSSEEDYYDQDSNSRKFSPDMSKVTTINTTIYSQDEKNATPIAQQISATFQDKRLCHKRKQTEEPSDERIESAKTGSIYQAAKEDKLHPTLKRSRSVPPDDENTCQFSCTASASSYSGRLFYHCEPRTDRSPNHTPFTPHYISSFSRTAREDGDVLIFSNLNNENATLSEVVLLDISSKSSEKLVSYKQTSGVGSFAARNPVQNSEGAKDPDKGANIMRSCASAGGKDCVHNSVSTSHVSDHASSPGQHAFKCSLCERTFSQRGSLNRHVRSHLGVRPFPCPRCPMTFSRQYRVMEHMRVHQRSDFGTDFPKPPASSV